MRAPRFQVPTGLIPNPACSGRVPPTPPPLGPARGKSYQVTVLSGRDTTVCVNRRVCLCQGFKDRGNSGGARVGLPYTSSNFSASEMINFHLLRSSGTWPCPGARSWLECKCHPCLRSMTSSRLCSLKADGGPFRGPPRGSFLHLPVSSKLFNYGDFTLVSLLPTLPLNT